MFEHFIAWLAERTDIYRIDGFVVRDGSQDTKYVFFMEDVKDETLTEMVLACGVTVYDRHPTLMRLAMTHQGSLMVDNAWWWGGVIDEKKVIAKSKIKWEVLNLSRVLTEQANFDQAV